MHMAPTTPTVQPHLPAPVRELQPAMPQLQSQLPPSTPEIETQLPPPTPPIQPQLQCPAPQNHPELLPTSLAAQQQAPISAWQTGFLATEHKEGQSVSDKKTMVVPLMTPEEAEFMEAVGGYSLLKSIPSATPQSDAAISLGTHSPLSQRHSSRGGGHFPPPTPLLSQSMNTMHEGLERLSRIEVQSKTNSTFEKELLEAQQKQVTASGKPAASPEDFKSAELQPQLAPPTPQLQPQLPSLVPEIQSQLPPAIPEIQSELPPATPQIQTQLSSPTPQLQPQLAPPTPQLQPQLAPPTPPLQPQLSIPTSQLQLQLTPPTPQLQPQLAPPTPQLQPPLSTPTFQLQPQLPPPMPQMQSQLPPAILEIQSELPPATPEIQPQLSSPTPQLQPQLAPPMPQLQPQLAPPTPQLQPQLSTPTSQLQPQLSSPTPHVQPQLQVPTPHVQLQLLPTSFTELQVPTPAWQLLFVATEHKEGQPVSDKKTMEVRQLTPEEAEFMEAIGGYSPLKFSPSETPRSKASISVTTLPPLPQRHTSRDEEQLPPPTPQVAQPENAKHEILECLTRLELQSTLLSTYEKELLEAQQKQATASGKLAATSEDLKRAELLAEVKDLRLVHLRLLLHHEAEAKRQKEVEKKVWEELSDLKGAVANLNATISTHSTSISEAIGTQGSAITQALKGLTTMVEQTAIAPTASIGKETLSISSTIANRDTFAMPSRPVVPSIGMRSPRSGSIPSKKGRLPNK